MRSKFFLIATLAVIPSIWFGYTCPAQVAKPEKILPEDPKVPVVEFPLLQAAPALPAVRLLPAMRRGPDTGLPFELANLVLAKFDESPKGPQLVALVEQTRTEQRNVPVTKIKQEERTRKVKVVDANGKESEVEQRYIVSIPVIENIDQPVQVPAVRIGCADARHGDTGQVGRAVACAHGREGADYHIYPRANAGNRVNAEVQVKRREGQAGHAN